MQIKNWSGLSHRNEKPDWDNITREEELLRKGRELLALEAAIVEQALALLLTAGALGREGIGNESLVFLPHLIRAEKEIAERIGRLATSAAAYPAIDFAAALAWCEQRTGKTLAPSQREALEQILRNRLTIVTGGPGVGKTTLVHSILTILLAKQVKCLLCAPTGRAAKRMSEATGLEAKTIHRLLETQPGTGRFLRNEKNPLDCDALIVDETSTVDVPLLSDLLRALPARAHLLLVGDVDQLPSVGPGSVLRNLIESGAAPVVRLTFSGRLQDRPFGIIEPGRRPSHVVARVLAVKCLSRKCALVGPSRQTATSSV